MAGPSREPYGATGHALNEIVVCAPDGHFSWSSALGSTTGTIVRSSLIGLDIGLGQAVESVIGSDRGLDRLRRRSVL